MLCKTEKLGKNRLLPNKSQICTLTDVFCTMREYAIEPKRMRLVAPSAGKAANLVLIEGMKGGGAFLKTEPTLYIYNENREFTEEINRIYERS